MSIKKLGRALEKVLVRVLKAVGDRMDKVLDARAERKAIPRGLADPTKPLLVFTLSLKNEYRTGSWTVSLFIQSQQDFLRSPNYCLKHYRWVKCEPENHLGIVSAHLPQLEADRVYIQGSEKGYDHRKAEIHGHEDEAKEYVEKVLRAFSRLGRVEGKMSEQLWCAYPFFLGEFRVWCRPVPPPPLALKPLYWIRAKRAGNKQWIKGC